MAVLLLESWEGISTLNEKHEIEHTSNCIIDTTYQRTGDQGLRLRASYWLKITLASAIDAGVVGFSYRNTNTGRIDDTFRALIMLYKGSGKQFTLEITQNGFIWIKRNTTLMATSNRPLIAGKRYYFEIKWNCVNSIGADTFVIKVNGEEWFNFPATTDMQAQSTSGVDVVYLHGGGAYVFFDDLYICDTTGGVNDDFLGDVAIVCLTPNGNGNTNDFTGSDVDSTDNYLHVDEIQPDDDASYVESSDVADIDLYAFENFAVTPTTICCVQTVTFAKKDDASAKTGKLLTRVNSTNYEGSAFSPENGSYAYFTEIWDVNPDDSAAWAEADVNGAEFGIKVES